MNNTNYHRGWDLYLQDGKPTVHIIHSWPGDFTKVKTKKDGSKVISLHVFATYNGSSVASVINIYVNGEKQQLQVDKNNLKGSITSNATLNMGRHYTEAPFTGMIDNVAVYDRELTNLEVIGLYGKSPVNNLVKLGEKRNEKQNKLLNGILKNVYSKGY